MGIAVRQALHSDTNWLLSQLRAFSIFFGTTKELFPDEPYARQAIIDMLERHLILIAQRDTERVGFIAGFIAPHPFNPSIKTLAETFWWVPEEHRGTRAGLLLLNAFTDWGKKNVDWITFALEDKSPIKTTTLQKRGYHLKERNFLLECG